MKCHYQLEDGPWREGEVTSSSGQLAFSRRDGSGRIVHEVVLSQPEVRFGSTGFRATGYVSTGQGVWALVIVDARMARP